MTIFSEYECHVDTISILETSALTLPALRLAHACLYTVDQRPGLSLPVLSLHKDKCVIVLCSEVMAIAGASGANDNRMISKAIEDLQGKGIFKTIHLSNNGRNLHFRFSQRIFQSSVKTKKASLQ